MVSQPDRCARTAPARRSDAARSLLPAILALAAACGTEPASDSPDGADADVVGDSSGEGDGARGMSDGAGAEVLEDATDSDSVTEEASDGQAADGTAEDVDSAAPDAAEDTADAPEVADAVVPDATDEAETTPADSAGADSTADDTGGTEVADAAEPDAAPADTSPADEVAADAIEVDTDPEDGPDSSADSDDGGESTGLDAMVPDTVQADAPVSDGATADADAAIADTTSADTAGADTANADTASADTAIHDTLSNDTSKPDTTIADTTIADTSSPDTSSPDTSQPDTSIADTSSQDTSQPDTSMADTSSPDSSGPDTSQADTAIVDTFTADTSIADSSIADTAQPDTSSPDATPVDSKDADADTAECATATDCAAKPAPGLCKEWTCAGGACVVAPVNKQIPCDDNNLCTDTSVCYQGLCQGAPKPCSDDDPCTFDSCHPEKGCVHQPSSSSCNDGSVCTKSDVCSAGVCKGTPIVCNDNKPCTTDSCDAIKGCLYAPHTGTCDDGNPCTTGDACANGACVPGGATNCDDGNACTYDSCSSSVGCQHKAVTSGACSDGSVCTTGDACSYGACKGKAITCNDNNACTADSCDASKGCVFAATTAPCDDSDACTASDVCAGGACSGTKINCDDANLCTADACDKAKGCTHAANTSPCDDGNPCTTDDSCAASACAGKAKACDDGNPCSKDACVVGLCQHTTLTGACDDGNDCTQGDACTAGTCQGTTAAAGSVCFGGGGSCHGKLCCPAKTAPGKFGCELVGKKNIVFASSTTSTGNLGGLTGADATCSALAGKANLAGKHWRAWLSSTKVDARDRLGEDAWYRPDGVLVSATKAGLLDDALDAAIGFSERGVEIATFTTQKLIWSNTKYYGVNNTAWGTCGDWTGTGGKSWPGSIGHTKGWSSSGGASTDWPCSAQRHLVCFQIDCPNLAKVDLLQDKQNCGACGHVCPGATVCSAGVCQAPTGKLAFVTAAAVGGATGGLAAADAQCQQEADAANLVGTYRAWLATGALTAASRVSSAAYVRVDGVAISADKATMAAGKLLAPLAVRADGSAAPAGTTAWTGQGGHCGDWTSATASGGYGDTNAQDASWQQAGVGACSGKRALYCLQDDCPGSPDKLVDSKNCGACGVVCPGETTCEAGVCVLPGKKMAFVTSSAVGAKFPGLAGADAICAARAKATNLGGSWMAWLSAGTIAAKTRVADAAYYRLDGVAIATSLQDLTDGQLAAPLQVQENGALAVNLPSFDVWTGTTASGLATPKDFHQCFAWTHNTSAQGLIGLATAKDAKWTEYAPALCTSTARLYCFQQ